MPGAQNGHVLRDNKLSEILDPTWTNFMNLVELPCLIGINPELPLPHSPTDSHTSYLSNPPLQTPVY